MTVSLYKLTPPENATVLDDYPQLANIWEVPYLQERALKSYMNWSPQEKTGEIFLIKDNDRVVGLTGWWSDEKIKDTIRLRWHGVVLDERRKGYSDQALRLLAQHLHEILPETYKYISESLSIQRYYADQVRAHFEKLGFQVFDDPTYGTNGFGETISLRMRIPGR